MLRFRIHQVVVQLAGEALVQFHRFDVKGDAFVTHVVGTNGDRIAGDVATAEPATFEYRHVGNAVILRQVISGCQAMPAGADDDDFVAFFQRWAAPGPLPVAVTAERVARQ